MPNHYFGIHTPPRWSNRRKDRLHFTAANMVEPVRPVPPPSRLEREPGCAFGAVMLMGAPFLAAGVYVAQWLGA